MQPAVMHSKIEFNAKARARNLELPNDDRLSLHRAASSLICLFPLSLVFLLHRHPFPLRYTSLISGIDRKYKVVIPWPIYLTLAAHRKVSSRSAKWARRQEWIAGYRAEDLSSSIFFFFFFPFFFFAAANLRETEAGWRSASRRYRGVVVGEVA